MEKTHSAPPIRMQNWITWVSAILAVQVIAVMLYLVRLPASAGGFSTPRLILFALFAVMGLGLILWYLVLTLKPGLAQSLTKSMTRYLQQRNFEVVSLSALSSAVCIDLILDWASLPPTYEIQVALPRLAPILALLTLLCIEVLLLALLVNRDPAGRTPSTLLYALVRQPGRLARLLAMIIALLVVISTFGQVIKYGFPSYFRFVDFLVVEFFLDSEMNVPTFFSALLTIGSAAVFAWTAWRTRQDKRPFSFHWAFLSLLFIILTFDEVFSLHEKLTGPMQDRIYAVGLLYWPWFLPILPLLAVLFFVYLRFFLRLPRRTFWLFMLSSAVYLGASIVLEALGAAYADEYGLGNFTYTVISTVEESAEMSGLVLLLYTLFDYHRQAFQTPLSIPPVPASHQV